MERFIVTVGEGRDAFTIVYDDYGNAQECALIYREMGLVVKVRIEE